MMYGRSNIVCGVFLLLIYGSSCGEQKSETGNRATIWKNGKQLSILDFEADVLSEALTFENASGKLSEKGLSQGKQSMDIQFQSDVAFSGFSYTLKTPIAADMLGDYSLVFEASNTGSHSTHLYVIVENEKGEQRKRSVSIAANGEVTTYFFELEGPYLRKDTNMRDNPNPYPSTVQMKMRGRITPIDFSKITRIQFFVKHTLFDKSVTLDNLRLVENPPLPKDYLVGLVDKFGQNTKQDFEGKITSAQQLKTKADGGLAQLQKEGPMPGRSTYGGWSDGPKLEATGFFRTTKYKGKWALVDPEGYLFFSSGIANVRLANTTTFTGRDFKNDTVRYRNPEDVTPEDSRGMVPLNEGITSTAFISHPWRYDFFEELPKYGDDLANHFSYRREQHFGPFEHGETFSFYQANLERRYGEATPGAHLKKWVTTTQDRFLNWGFTSFGNWAGYEFYHENRMPYFANGWIIGDFKTVRSGFDFWGEMPDVFDPEFERRAKITVSVVAEEVRNNPWCIGVFIDNEKSWGVPGTVKGQYGIVLDALSKNTEQSPLKKAFTQVLQKKYKSVQDLNLAWNTSLDSWETLANGVDFSGQEHFADPMVHDFSTLLKTYADQYFKVVRTALKEVMPDHMYLGCRFAPWGMGKEVLEAAKTYVDVFSYNYYEEGIGPKTWAFLEDIDRPAIIGEFHIGTAASGLFHHGVIHASDQEDRGKMYKDYLYSVLDNPYFVGAHWFQYIDSPVSGRAHDGENYNVGYVNVADVPYPAMVKATKEAHRTLYERRFGNQ